MKRVMRAAALIVWSLAPVLAASAQTGVGFDERNRTVMHIAFVHAKPGKER